jgi:hypothetical protein
MRKFAVASLMVAFAISSALASSASAEILALLNYESKPDDQLKELKLSSGGERIEGIAIMDVDPESENFGKILMTFPMPADLVAHHIFYDRTMTKAYITALGQPQLHVMDMTANP